MNVALFRLALTVYLPLALAGLTARGAAAAGTMEGYAPHPDFTVTAGGRPLHVWRGRVSTETRFLPRPHQNATHEVAFVIFDLEAPMEVTVQVAQPAVGQVAIKPDRAGIQPVVEGQVIRIPLERAGNFIVELNQSAFDHLYIFANAPETQVPRKGDRGVRYFGPGVHEAGLINDLEDNQTVYLAPGAVVRGRLHLRDKRGIRICGRGILDAAGEPDRSNPILLDRCEDVRIEDIVILNARGWTVRLNESRRLAVENIRIICSHQNSDGIDPLNCEDVTIRHAFIRNYDDGVVIKAMRGGSSRRILTEGCLIITDHATSLKIGANETMGEEIRDVVFRDCDILHSCAVHHLAVMDQGTAAIANVRFEDIRIENGRVNFMGVKSGARKAAVCLVEIILRDRNVYATQAGESFIPGSIRDVVFKNITYTHTVGEGAAYSNRIEGLNGQHRVANVTFENFQINGRTVLNAIDGYFEINPFVDNVRFLGRAPE